MPTKVPRWLASFLALITTGSLLASCPAGGNGSASESASKPNIVVIQADDLDLAALSRFPGLRATFVDRGTTFANHVVTDSLCCPSRASMLRGQLVHNHRVLNNIKPDGGYLAWMRHGNEDSTIGTWLQGAGYRTGLIGKYLNGYPELAGLPDTHVPRGWDEWISPVRGVDYYDYKLNENGTVRRFGRAPRDYFTDVLARKASRFIKGSDQPFYLHLTPYAPHGPATPAPRHANAFPGVKAPRGPSFNQAHMSTYPAWLRDAPRLGPVAVGEIDQLYRKRLQSMLAVQDMVAKVVDTLREQGELANTYLMFTSDNGFHLGQHRLEPGKQTAFEEDIHTPLLVRGPGVAAGRTDKSLVANIDIAPTVAALAGANAPAFVDGRSLVPLLRNQQPSWRKAMLVEHFPKSSAGRAQDPDNDGGTRAAANKPPTYHAVRTSKYTYVEYVTGERELYDLVKDPRQLTNIARSADPALLRELHQRLVALRDCAGATCRQADRG